MSGLLLAFILIDGLVSRNPQPWAAPIRAGLVAALFLIGVALLWRARVRVEPGAVVVIGVLAALVISDVYRTPTGLTLSTWLVYAGAYALQRAIQRDWTRDLAATGVALAALVIVVAVAGISPPAGAWNRNVTGGILLATLAASTQIARRWRIVAPILILAGIGATAGRGALVGALVTVAVMIQPWALLAAPIAAIALTSMRPYEANTRLLFWIQGIEALTSSPFGVGVGRLITPGDGRMGVAVHVHNSLLGIVAQVGVIGVAVASATIAIARRAAMQRWQIATLAGVAAHSMVDDPLCWLPVGVILALVSAKQNGVSNQRQSVV